MGEKQIQIKEVEASKTPSKKIKCIVPSYEAFEKLLDLGAQEEKFKTYVCNHYPKNKRKVYCPKSFYERYIGSRKKFLSGDSTFKAKLIDCIEFIDEAELRQVDTHRIFDNEMDRTMTWVMKLNIDEALECSFAYADVIQINHELITEGDVEYQITHHTIFKEE